MTKIRQTKLLRSSHTSEVARQERNSSLESTTTVSSFAIVSKYNKLCVEFLSDEPGLEFKEDLVFPDGTVYKG